MTSKIVDLFKANLAEAMADGIVKGIIGTTEEPTVRKAKKRPRKYRKLLKESDLDSQRLGALMWQMFFVNGGERSGDGEELCG